MKGTSFVLLAVYTQCFLLSLFLAGGEEEGFIQAVGWEGLGSGHKDAPLLPLWYLRTQTCSQRSGYSTCSVAVARRLLA